MKLYTIMMIIINQKRPLTLLPLSISFYCIYTRITIIKFFFSESSKGQSDSITIFTWMRNDNKIS